MEPSWLFWHRRDLRLADNLGLHQLHQHCRCITGLFVLEPALWQAEDAAAARLWFLLRSLEQLQAAWAALGSRLLVLQGDPNLLIPQLAQQLGSSGVAFNEDVEPQVRQRDHGLQHRLEQQGVKVQRCWDQLLVPPEQLGTAAGRPYTVYGPYKRGWFKQTKLAPCPAPSQLSAVDPGRLAAVRDRLPLVELLADGVPWCRPWTGTGSCPCLPGEQAALQQLEHFSTAAICLYDSQRDIPSLPGTSWLSAALRFGTIGPRTVWQAAEDVRAACRSDEARHAVTVWQQELAWREFYQQALFHFPALAQGPFRRRWRHFPWDNDEQHFAAWCEARTGCPIVDAAMRQLQETGWMHNRCRMIVASFLTKDLICDWRWGEQHFMAHLVDGDLAANNGGWQWSASSGMDPRPLRIFNPAIQARKFDADADYIRRWLPELASCNTADLLSGDIAPIERRGYPAPRVNHREQQQRFKAIYAHTQG